MAHPSQSSSNSEVLHPYGQASNQLFNRLNRSQLSPLLQGLGFGGNQKFEDRLATSQGPLAGAIRDIRGFSGNVIPQAQSIGNAAAKQGQAAANQQRGQVQSALSALPGYQALASQGIDMAQAFNQGRDRKSVV